MQLADLQTPALLIHLDRVRHNLTAMKRWLGGDMDRWRPHVKTCKVPEVLTLYFAAGVRRFKCATTREVEVLLTAADALPDTTIDVLFAMAQHGKNLDRLRALAIDHPAHRIAVLSEDAAHATEVSASGLGVFVDLDPGYHRTGIPLGEVGRIAGVVAAAGTHMRGLHCYDGHLHDRDATQRRSAAFAIYTQFAGVARELSVRGELVTSGTPTFPDALAFADFSNFEHTVSPGTVIYWDTRSEALGIAGFQFAVEVHAKVISRPTNDRFTVDAGSKALDAAVRGPCARLLGPWQTEVGVPSEEHLPIRMTAGEAPPVGTAVRLIPAHVCPTVNLADDAVLLENGQIVAIVSVRARGHETTAVARSPSR